MHHPTPRVLARRRQIGTHIRDARLWSNLSQEELAELANISRDTVHRIEYGTRAAKLDWLIQIADALELPLSDLMREDNETPDAQRDEGS